MAPLTSHLLERCDPFHRVHVNGASSKAFASSYPGKEPPVMVTPVVGAVSGGCHRSGPRYATEHQNAAYTGSTGLISITTPPQVEGKVRRGSRHRMVTAGSLFTPTGATKKETTGLRRVLSARRAGFCPRPDCLPLVPIPTAGRRKRVTP
jgi:hypothetical protein